MGNELFCYFENFSFSKIKNINGLRTQISLAAPEPSSKPSLAGYNSKHIFRTGGKYGGYRLNTVEVYNVDRDEWSQCPKSIIARNNHLSCVLGDKLYISGGDSSNYNIHVADCSKLIDGSAEWNILSFDHHVATNVFSPISSTEILIMHKEAITIFDARSNTIEKVGDIPFRLQCDHNQAAMSRDGQVVAQVFDFTSKCLKAVSFTKETMEFRVIKDFGSIYYE